LYYSIISEKIVNKLYYNEAKMTSKKNTLLISKLLFMIVMVFSIQLLFACSSESTSPVVEDEKIDPLPDPQPKVVEPEIAFINVNLIPMTSETVIPNQTVIIGEKEILEIGDSESVVLPENITVIDGAEKYLIPGLADMHYHIIDVATDLIIPVTQGFTTMLEMGNAGGVFVDQSLLKREINEGTRFGPTLYISLFAFGASDGKSAAITVATTDAAKIRVDQAVAGNFDFIKVRDGLTSQVFNTLLNNARSNRLNLMGHAPRVFGANQAIKNGQVLLAHSEEHVYTDFGAAEPSSAQLIEAAQTLKENDAYLITTLVVEEMIAQIAGNNAEGISYMNSYPGTEYVSSITKGVRWLNTIEQYNTLNRARQFGLFELQKNYVRSMIEQDVKILLGTDAVFGPGLAPGFSAFREMRFLIELGMTPYQALQTATSYAGEFIDKYAAKEVEATKGFGMIEVGRRADMVLLNENPLLDISNLENRVGVMIRGKWFTEDELKAMLDSLK